jgi:hypothetical protein
MLAEFSESLHQGLFGEVMSSAETGGKVSANRGSSFSGLRGCRDVVVRVVSRHGPLGVLLRAGGRGGCISCRRDGSGHL